MVKNKIPDENDWGDYKSDIDWAYAHNRFAGKSIHDVLPYFDDDGVLNAQEELNYMPPIPFQYYIFAFAEYLASEELDGENSWYPDALSGTYYFLLLVRNKLKHSPEIIAPVMDELMPIVEQVVAQRAAFNAEQERDGSLEDLLLDIRQLNATKNLHTDRLSSYLEKYTEHPSDTYEFLISIRDRFKSSSETIGLVRDALMQFVEAVANHPTNYRVDPNKIESLEDLIQEIRQLNESSK